LGRWQRKAVSTEGSGCEDGGRDGDGTGQQVMPGPTQSRSMG
jgi:hypothetical protein